ncbi:hypothetical protein AgCh_021999 [Apium graveolens]
MTWITGLPDPAQNQDHPEEGPSKHMHTPQPAKEGVPLGHPEDGPRLNTCMQSTQARRPPPPATNDPDLEVPAPKPYLWAIHIPSDCYCHTGGAAGTKPPSGIVLQAPNSSYTLFTPRRLDHGPTPIVSSSQGTIRESRCRNLEALQANFTVKEGVLSLIPADPSIKVVSNSKIASWSDMVKSNADIGEPGFSYNEDGSVTLIPTREFLLESRKQWDTSYIGHFIGSSFDFKFVRDRALSMWQKKGLSKVYYNSKGYFTFKFGTVEEMNHILDLNSV